MTSQGSDASDQELDAIVRHIDIHADVERVWALVSRPGWWINGGAVVVDAADVLDGGWHVVRDPVHGPFSVQAVQLDEHRSAAFRWTAGVDRRSEACTLVEITITPAEGVCGWP